MRIWRNLTIGFIGSAWTAVIGLAVVPFYLRYLGVEAYGLVGFFIALQAIMQLLDLGLGPTISREVARCQATSVLPEARNLLRTLSVFYWSLAGLIAVATVTGSPWIGSEWLQPDTISHADIAEAVALMGIVIAIRFPIGLYLGAIQGAHRLAEASALNAAVATCGALGTIAVLALISPTIKAFFLWQVAVAVVHLVIVRWAAWRLLGGGRLARFDLSLLRRIGRFAAAMSIVSVLGVLLSQLDKLVLSRVVDLAELGRYTFAGIPARSLSLLSYPVFSVVYSQLSALVAVGDTAGIAALYKNGTRLFLALLLPLAAFVGLFATEIIVFWTGDAELSRVVGPVAKLLIFGSALNGIMIFPFALQLAYGNSRLPALITFVLIIGFAPMLFWLIADYGILGGAAAWLVLNAVYIPFGTWLTHRSILPGQGWKWLLGDVGIPLTVTATVMGGGYLLVDLVAFQPLRLVLGAGLIPLAFSLIVAISPTILPRRFAGRFFAKSFRKFV